MLTDHFKQIQEQYKTLEQVLGGYFHQDSGSFEEATLEVLKNSKEGLQQVVTEISDFLDNKSVTDEDKNQFLIKKVDLSFEYENLDPLEWLQSFADQIEEHLQKI